MNQENNVNVELNGSSLPVKREQALTLTASPVADIFETHDTFVVALDLPGAQKESIQVMVEPGSLHVRASVRPRQTQAGRMIHREIGWNTYDRTFKIGPGVDTSAITAEFTDGVLSVVLPKTEGSRSRQIHIQ